MYSILDIRGVGDSINSWQHAYQNIHRVWTHIVPSSEDEADAQTSLTPVVGEYDG